jgi:hypothetical protein
VKEPKRKPSALAQAAIALDDELHNFEQLAATAHALPLTSQKNLDRAARATNEAADSQRRLGEHIRAFMEALNVARDQNQRTADTLQARGQEIQARVNELQALLARFAEIGNAAKELSSTVKALGAEKRGPTTADRLKSVESGLARVVDDAQSLATAAKTASFPEVVAQVDSLRQQVLSARNKVALLIQKLGD